MSVHPDQILYIQANDNYSKVITTLNITFTVRTTLKEIECMLARLSKTKFVRVHSGYIIRLAGLTFDKIGAYLPAGRDVRAARTSLALNKSNYNNRCQGSKSAFKNRFIHDQF